MKKLLMIITLAIFMFSLTSCTPVSGASEKDIALKNEGSTIAQLAGPEDGEEIAVIETNKGTIKLRLFPQYAPKAVENFVTHAKDGYYDGLIFHRVMNEFMIQGGDPEGTGIGGESIWGKGFGEEINLNLHHIRGALAMAKSSLPDSQGSQFYIVQSTDIGKEFGEIMNYYLDHQEDEVKCEQVTQNITTYSDYAVVLLQQYAFDNNLTGLKVKDIYPREVIEKYLSVGGAPFLDLGYTVFGQVFEGIDVVDDIASVETSQDQATKDKPLQDIVIKSIKIVPYGK